MRQQLDTSEELVKCIAQSLTGFQAFVLAVQVHEEKNASSRNRKHSSFEVSWAFQTDIIQWNRLQLNLKLRLRVCSCDI